MFSAIQVSPFETAMTMIQALGGLAGVAALVAVAWSVRSGVKSTALADRAEDATERRDTVADRDALIDQLQEEATALRAKAAERDAAIAARDAVIRQQAEYIAVCRDHIYRGRPAPPPPPPA